MELPNKIKVAGFDVTVKEWYNEHASDSNAFGDFKASTLTIRVDCSVDKYKVIDTHAT